MSSAHDVLARSVPGAVPAGIGAEVGTGIGAQIGTGTVVEPVAPGWRWRIITPGQWRVLSRLGRRAAVGDLAGPGDPDAADVVDRVVELVRAGFCAPEGVPAVSEPVAGPPPVAEPPEPVATTQAPEPAGTREDEPAVGPELAAEPLKWPAADPVTERVEDALGVLPRREPGRTLSPVAALLQQRHAQLRRNSREDEFKAPDTETLRRLLGSLQHLDDPARSEHGTGG